jgi:hypothetical protein
MKRFSISFASVTPGALSFLVSTDSETLNRGASEAPDPLAQNELTVCARVYRRYQAAFRRELTVTSTCTIVPIAL